MSPSQTRPSSTTPPRSRLAALDARERAVAPAALAALIAYHLDAVRLGGAP